MHTIGYNQCRIFVVMLAMFFATIIVIGIFYNDYFSFVPNDGDDDFWDEEAQLRYVSYDALNVSAAVDERLLVRRVRDPCVAPYELACGRWTANGSYLHDNAMVLHARRLHRAVAHASSAHPWVSAVFAQCMQQMVAPYDSASIGAILQLLEDVECDAALSASPNNPDRAISCNLQRIQRMAERGIFVFFLWQNGSAPFIEPSPWTSSAWHPQLTKLACAISAANGDTNECIVAVDTMLSATAHIAASRSPQPGTQSSYSARVWADATRSQLPLRGLPHVWSDANFQLMLRALAMPAAATFLRAAAAADALMYVGLPAHHISYGSVQFGADAAARHLLSTLERAHPPALYGWGALGSSLFLAAAGSEHDERLHPAATDSCLLALGDIYPRAVGALIAPPRATIDRVRAAFAAIQRAFADKLAASTMFKPAFRDLMAARVRDMALWLDDDDEKTEGHPEIGATFVASALAARRANWLRASLGNNSGRGDVGNYNFHAETLNALYMPQHNAVYAPTGLLLQPFLSADADVETLYGRLGAVLAHEAAHVLDRFALQRATLISGEDFRLLANMFKCFSNALQPDIRFDEREMYPDMLGFELAYRACVAAGGCATPERRNAFFFLYGQTLCANRGTASAAYDTHASARDRVTAAATMAVGADGRGFGALQWACYDPPTCSF